MANKEFKKGGVSIFIVIMVSILVSIMSASFLRIMFRDQEQANKLDLSQSAYDSAQAGVEDAKRFLRIYKGACGSTDAGTKVFEGKTYDCSKMAKAILSDSCYVLATAGIGAEDGETMVQTTTGVGGKGVDRDLDQAYTCVKIKTDTSDFLGQSNEGTPSVVSLKGTSSFNQIRIRWHTKNNIANGSKISLDSINNPNTRPNLIKDWQVQNRPAILKTQLYGYVPGYNGNSSTSMDTPYPDDGNGASEMLFYPASGLDSRVVNSSKLPTIRRDENSLQSTNDYTFTKCSDNLGAGSNIYACEMVVNIGRNVSPTDVLYARLTPLLNNAEFKVELMNNGTIVDLKGVQPKVDSTGRANRQFRRVESRIGFYDSNFPVPLFSAQTEGDEPICKDFSTTKIKNGGLTCKI